MLDLPSDIQPHICICGEPMVYNGIWPWVGKAKPVTQGEGYHRLYCLRCTDEKHQAVGVAIRAENPPTWTGDWTLGQ